jgi:hypothetical protein
MNLQRTGKKRRGDKKLLTTDFGIDKFVLEERIRYK